MITETPMYNKGKKKYLVTIEVFAEDKEDVLNQDFRRCNVIKVKEKK